MDMRTLLLTMSTMAAIALSAAETLVVDVHSHFTTDGYLELVAQGASRFHGTGWNQNNCVDVDGPAAAFRR